MKLQNILPGNLTMERLRAVFGKNMAAHSVRKTVPGSLWRLGVTAEIAQTATKDFAQPPI